MMQRKWLSGGKKKRGFFAALVAGNVVCYHCKDDDC